MPLSLDQFVEQVTSSGLLPSEEVEQLRRDAKGANVEQFARELVKQKKLTAFQAQQCFAGKGKTLALGNYIVLDKLGQGGMGMVLKAQHRRMKRLVAVKVLSPSVSKSAELIKRFQREVEAAARLTHPNIVAAYDSDEANGTVFLVMEFVDGKDLSSLVKSKGPLPVDRAVHCILQAAKGLEYAHKNGIIHRDIKPANLLLSNEGSIKILDMGLARIEGEAGHQAELTNTGAVMGTIDYMAPEQALNTKSADARSDIYSLGISLWYLLVGRPTYEADSLMARLLAHREAPIPSLAAARSGVPLALDNLFQKMVAKKPEDRFASMTDVVAALEAGFQNEGGTPTLTTGSSEASKFNDFLQDLNDVSAGVAVTSSSKTRKARKGSRSDATMLSSDSDIPTDPETLTRLPGRLMSTTRTVASRVSASGTGWRDRRIQAAIGGGLLLVLGLLFVLPRGKSPEVSQVESNPTEQVIVEQRPRMPANDPERPVSQSLSAEGLASSSSLNDSSRVISASGTSQPIDLLPLVRTVSPHSGNPWTREAGTIEIPPSGNSRTLIDAPVPSEYEVHMDVVPLRGRHSVLLGLVTSGGRFWIPVSGFGDAADGADGSTRIEPRPTGGTGIAETSGRVLFTNRKSSLIFTVRTNRVTLVCDGKTLIDWQGDPSRLQEWPQWRIPDSSKLGIGAWHSQMRITRLELRPLIPPPADQSSAPAMAPSSQDSREGWTELFNGRDLTGWKPMGPQGWRVENGMLVGRTSNARGWLMSEREFGDFELQVEYRIPGGANSGVFVRAWPEGNVNGGEFNEIQIIDETHPSADRMDELRWTGALYGTLASPRLTSHGPNQWHSMTVHVQGNQLTSQIDGVPTAAGPLRANSRARGRIGIQLYPSGIDIRAVRVRELPAEEDQPPVSGNSSVRPVLEFAARSQVKVNRSPLAANEQYTIEVWTRRASQEFGKEGAGIFMLDPNNGLVYTHTDSWGSRYLSADPMSKRGVAAPADLAKPDEWTHVAAVRSEDSLKLYVNGRQRGQTASIPPGNQADTSPFWPFLGYNLEKYSYFGQMAGARLTRGVRYPGEFTPPPFKMAADQDTVLLYHMDEGNGDRLTDLSGKGHHGTIEGAKWTTAAVPAELARAVESTPAPTSRAALKFDGVNDYVDLTSDWHWDGGDLTFDAWVTLQELQKTQHLVSFDHGEDSHRHGGRITRVYTPGVKPGLAIGLSAIPHPETSRFMTEFPIERPVHIAAVWTKGTQRLFIDGKSQPRRPYNFPFSQRVSRPYTLLGGILAPDGKVAAADNMTMYQARFTATALFEGDFEPPAELTAGPDTIGLYQFTEGAGDVLHDSSGKNRHGKIHGAVWVPGASLGKPSAPSPAFTSQ